MLTILGVTDEITICECCGKKNLRDTVCLEETETGEVKYFGSICAARALGGKDKSTLVLARAKARQKALPVIEVVRTALVAGAAVEAAVALGRQAAKGACINGCGILVNGYASWGCVNVDWNGGRETLPVK